MGRFSSTKTSRSIAWKPSYWPVIAVFVGMTVLQVSVAVFSIYLLSSVRAYVTGESLYSKGQKDAQIYLLEYAENNLESDHERFMAALAVPLADRAAREALQQVRPDATTARRKFLEGGNHPDDVDGLIRIFRWFQHVPFMSRPIATWTEGDQVIEQMRLLVDRARERILAGDSKSLAVVEMRRQAPVLNEQLTRLTSAFSSQLGEASRTTQRFLLGLNGSIAVLLTVTGLGFVRRSARVQAATQAEVVHRQQALQRLLDSAAEGLYGVDVAGQCTFVNKAALRMLGYERESELLGRDIDAVIRHLPGGAQSRPGMCQDSHCTRLREPSHSLDEEFRRRDGSVFPVESWSHPVMDDDVLQGAVVTFFDISARLEMQAALQRGELRMERLVDAVTDAVVTIDAHRKIIFFNRAAEAMFGIGAGDAAGKEIDGFIIGVPATDAASLEDHAADEPAGPTSETGLHELVGRRNGGQEFAAEASLSRLETDSGVLTTVVLRDVTISRLAETERRARQALEAASRAKTEFLSRMSHELRTPLNAVIGFAQLLRLDVARPLSIKQLEHVEHVEAAGAHLLALVNDVLDLSRIEAGEMAITLQALPLSVSVEEAATLVSPLVTAAGIEITWSPEPADHCGPDRGAWVLADPVRLRQVLVNLLSNAVKYNRPGGSVNLTWKVRQDRCTIRVADTGLGIAADRLASLFEPFNRLGAEESSVEGTGIGLVLSRQLVEMMGGSLDITSVASEGTVATLDLALATPHAAAEATATATSTLVLQPAGHPRQPLSVLYAEDNEVNAEIVRAVVAFRPGITLRIATSGASALEMARANPPDLLLVDMNLGDMTGIELAGALQMERSTRAIPLIGLSADALPEQIAAAMLCGFENYLTKPIDFCKLLGVLDQHSERT